MNRNRVFGCLLCVGIVGLFAGSAMSGDENKKGHGEGDDGKAMMEAMMKVGAPVAFHAHLKPLAGNWKTVTKHWMQAESEPSVSEGTCEKKMILGGRYLQETFTSSAMGMPFKGVGIIGYDKGKQQYTSVWVDSMTTMMMIDSGTCDASGKVFTFHGELDDPFSGMHKKTRSIMKVINNNKHVFEMFETPDGMKEYKSLEVVYTKG